MIGPPRLADKMKNGLEAGRTAVRLSASMKIVCAYALTDSQRRTLEESSEDAEIRDKTCRSPDEVGALMSGGCDVLLAFRIPADPLRHAPDLKWVQLLSAGADHALKGPLANVSVPVTTASGIHATPIAEYVIASMLAFSHRFHLA